MEEFRDETLLADAIQERIRGQRQPLIGVDGAYGSGKSTLAKALAEALGGRVFELDQYTQQDGQPYRQQLRYTEMERDLRAARAPGRPIVVDGICLLDVLDRIKATADVLVYVKRIDNAGIWNDEDTCDPAWIDLTGGMLNMPGSELAREVASYHVERDPLRTTDFLFVRIE